MDAASFRKEFGLDYTPKLILPDGLPESFTRECERFGREQSASLPRAGLEEALDRLARPAPVPGRIVMISPDVGRGLFASRAVARGEIIGEYAGVLTADWKPLSEGGPLRAYLMRYPFESAFAIDAETVGNELRFVNHSARPNAGRRYVFCEGVVRVVFVAERPIARGAQILLDYGQAYWRGRPPVELEP